MSKCIFIVLSIISFRIHAQVQLQVGAGVAIDRLSGGSDISLGDEATITLADALGAQPTWFVYGLKKTGDKSYIRLGLELMNGSSDIFLFDPFTNELIGNNQFSFHKIGLPVDFQYQPVKFVRLTAGASANNYFSPSGNFIGLDPGKANWDTDEIQKIFHAIDVLRTYSFDYRFGIMLTPVKNVFVECIRSATITTLNNPMVYNGEDQGLKMKYRVTQFRIGYTLEI